MKRQLLTLIFLLLCCSCIENTVDSQHIAEQTGTITLRSLMTRSSVLPQEDSLTIMSRLQSDVDNLMMGRVVKKDSIFVLAIKKEDALFLGVSEEVYENYLDYINRLNEQITDE